MKNTFFAVLGALAMVSCSTMSTSKAGRSQINITDTKWALADEVKGSTPTLTVEAGKITGNGGCNNYFGDLTLDPTAGNFSVKNVGATKKVCQNMDVEDNYFRMLNESTHYVVKGNTLELYKGNLLLLKFNKQ